MGDEKVGHRYKEGRVCVDGCAPHRGAGQVVGVLGAGAGEEGVRQAMAAVRIAGIIPCDPSRNGYMLEVGTDEAAAEGIWAAEDEEDDEAGHGAVELASAVQVGETGACTAGWTRGCSW